MSQITFTFENVGRVDGILDESLSPKTVEAVLKALPIESTVNTWGDEIYFSTHVKVNQETARVDVSVGDIAYWPPGQAICLFFGPTPASKDKEPKAASPVNVIGKLLDHAILRMVGDGCKVKVAEKNRMSY